VTRVRLPGSPWVRVDHALERGARVSARYDTLLAKVIAYGWNRLEAVERLEAALRDMVVGGVETNLDLLRAVVGSGWFRSGSYDTWTLEERLPELLEAAGEARALAAEAARALPLTPAAPGGAAAAGAVAWHGWPRRYWAPPAGAR